MSNGKSKPEFVECDACRAKPGSPMLCDACIERRKKQAWDNVPQFAVGDFVYIDIDKSIGEITSARRALEGGAYGYRVNYCQGKDLATGPRGGNGAVFRQGYPKPVTEAADVVFVTAVKLKREIAAITKTLDGLHTDYNALVHVRNILAPPPPKAAKGTDTPETDDDDLDIEDF